MNDTSNALAATVASDADSLRRSLRGLIREAEDALARLDEGGRPSTSITGRLLHSADDVEKYAARLDLLLNWAGSPLLSKEGATSALKTGARA